MEKEKKKKKIEWKKVVAYVALLVLLSSLSAYAAYSYSSTDVYYQKAGGGEITVKEALDELYGRVGVTGDYNAYRQGDTVQVGGEKFYVLYDSGKSDPTMEVIARSCLNNTNFNSQCADSATRDNYCCAFSSTQYWTGTSQNLNDTLGFVATDVPGRAKTYAKAKGAVSGRLLTYEEASTLQTVAENAGRSSNVYKMFWGKENTGNGYLYFWLGSSNSYYGSYVWSVDGYGVYLSGDKLQLRRL